MSATLRHTIGLELAERLQAWVQHFARVNEGFSWQGFTAANHYRWVLRFSIVLPEHFAPAYRLWARCRARSRAQDNEKRVQKQYETLNKNLSLALGLPLYEPSFYQREERGFMLSLDENPDDLSTWSAFADWLQDQQLPYFKRRGELIAALLRTGKGSALKVKYGIPVMALTGGKDG